MPKITKTGVITLEQLNDKLSVLINSKYKVIQKRSHLEIIEDMLRGCIVKVKQKDNYTNISLRPFIPSTSLAILLSIFCVGGSCAIMLYVNVLLGAILVPVSIFFRMLPSREIVSKVQGILAEVSATDKKENVLNNINGVKESSNECINVSVGDG